MKNADGQLYTIEGFAAALIMLITAYMVVNATSVYTAGDTHINDMQLEALGTDALTIMGTPADAGEYSLGTSMLRKIIEDPVSLPNETFKAMFLNMTNNETGAPLDYSRVDSTMDFIQFNATYTCRDAANDIFTYPISHSRALTGGEHTVRATKWVIADTGANCGGSPYNRSVLVEVLLWRD